MSSPADPKKKLQIEVPAGATHFAIMRLTRVNGTSKQEKMLGEPDAGGYIPDNWPVAEFSPKGVLDTWGEGRYRVEWYGGTDGDRMKGLGQSFDVAAPRSKRPSRRLKGSPEPDEPAELAEPIARATAQIATGQPIGVLELMALLEARTERAETKAAAQAERDRQFWAQQATQQQNMLTTLLTTMRGGGGGDSDLLRREMALDLERKMFELRQEIAADQDEPDDAEPDAREPPKDLDEAAERIGLAFLEQIEGAAPDLVSKMIPRFLAMLQSQGLSPTPEMQARIAAAQNGHANRR